MTMTEVSLIPILDLAPVLAGEPDALDATAGALCEALENIGFFFIVGHGIDWSLVREVYGQAARLHALDAETKATFAMSKGTGGYLTLGGGTSYASEIAGEVRKPNLNAAFFTHRGGYQDARWPELDGFRRSIDAYIDAMDQLAFKMLPIYARALGLASDWFNPYFSEPSRTLRMSHYPLVEHEENQWGLAPHTDSSFMTLLPANDVPGLEIRPAGHDWMQPPSIEQSFLVNSGDILKRWTNHRFLSTAHRVLNASGRDRYAMPYFYGASDDAEIEALPTCVSADNPAKHEPITYGDYQRWFINRNYANITGEAASEKAP